MPQRSAPGWLPHLHTCTAMTMQVHQNGLCSRAMKSWLHTAYDSNGAAFIWCHSQSTTLARNPTVFKSPVRHPLTCENNKATSSATLIDSRQQAAVQHKGRPAAHAAVHNWTCLHSSGMCCQPSKRLSLTLPTISHPSHFVI